MRLVLFDIDGTLCLTDGAGKRAVHRALIEVFGSTGPASHPFGGKTDPQIVRELMRAVGHGDDHIDANMGRLLELYVEYLQEELAVPGLRAHAMPGVHELLAALRADDRAVLGLLTGNLAVGAAAKLRCVGIDPSQFVVGAYGSDHETRRELPAIARDRLQAQRGIRVDGPDIVVIGDTPADIDCGRPVGARAIAVATGGFSVGELEEHDPHVVFEDLSDTDAVVAAIFG
jgi:phosphoglycolate phosphatase-like HAD superfamily hydrolase